jgi:SAM-dependent methyltransferase
MSQYFLKEGYVERAQPRYFKAPVEPRKIWQPNVYKAAAEWARWLSCTRIVDIGCGTANKLVPLHPEFEIVGLDYGENIEHCRAYGYGTWIEWNIEREPLPQLEVERSVIVSADVIEHLVDPLTLLGALKRLLERAPVAIVSTPERDLTHGFDHMGPPMNPAHAREWNQAEFRALLESSGLPPLRIELTESHDGSDAKETMMAIIPGALSDALQKREDALRE